MKTVMIFGTFDLFHKGHESYIRQAQSLGDLLVVVIARDANVKKLKKRPPDWDEHMRQKVVAEFLGENGKVILGHTSDYCIPIQEYKPDIIALGYDQKVPIDKFTQTLQERSLHPSIVRLESFEPEKYKTSKLRKN